jgi:hypothetical protein
MSLFSLARQMPINQDSADFIDWLYPTFMTSWGKWDMLVVVSHVGIALGSLFAVGRVKVSRSAGSVPLLAAAGSPLPVAPPVV